MQKVDGCKDQYNSNRSQYKHIESPKIKRPEKHIVEKQEVERKKNECNNIIPPSVLRLFQNG
ncbi:hypothetical protein GCM10027577_13840 [Spirosoma fluminis]